MLGNAASVVPELLARGAQIDIVTDQTSAHDPLAYLPLGVEFDEWETERGKEGFAQRARESGDAALEAAYVERARLLTRVEVGALRPSVVPR